MRDLLDGPKAGYVGAALMAISAVLAVVLAWSAWYIGPSKVASAVVCSIGGVLITYALGRLAEGPEE